VFADVTLRFCLIPPKPVSIVSGDQASAEDVFGIHLKF